MQPNLSHVMHGSDYISQNKFRDEITYSKIQRHLNDVNDKITEDDIRNIKIVIGGKEINDMSAELEKMIRGKLPVAL